MSRYISGRPLALFAIGLSACGLLEPEDAPPLPPSTSQSVAPDDSPPGEAPSFPQDAVLFAEAPGDADASPRAVQLRWPEATCASGVVSYTIEVDGSWAASVAAPTQTTALPEVAFDRAHRFVVFAEDGAGRRSSPLTSTDALSPTFPPAARGSATRRERGFLLRWPAASDDVGIESYTIQVGEETLAELAPTMLEYVYEPSAGAPVVVVASDAAGHDVRLTLSATPLVSDAPIEITDTFDDVFAGDVLAGGPPPPADRPRGNADWGPLRQVAGSGSFDDRAVDSMLHRRSRAMVSCYERQLALDPNLRGQVVVEFTLAPSGTVSDVHSVAGPGGSTVTEATTSCLVSTIRRFRFHERPVGGPVTYRASVAFNSIQ